MLVGGLHHTHAQGRPVSLASCVLRPASCQQGTVPSAVRHDAFRDVHDDGCWMCVMTAGTMMAALCLCMCALMCPCV